MRWRTLETTVDLGETCLTVDGRQVNYKRLDPEEPVVIRIRGPRKVKIICRYLFEPNEQGRRGFTLHVAIDGAQILSKVFRGSRQNDVFLCGEEATPAGDLRRAYVTVGDGWHELGVTAIATEQQGAVVARFFRETKTPPAKLVSYAPEQYAGVTQIQFESGNSFSYYTFTPELPLTCEVTGPTKLTVWTRLDFDHTMHKSQPYTLEAVIDGDPWQTFHYNAKKEEAAVYTDRPDVLPGKRMTMELPLGKGRHRVEIRCVRPEGCCVTAMIRIPAKDVR